MYIVSHNEMKIKHKITLNPVFISVSWLMLFYYRYEFAGMQDIRQAIDEVTVATNEGANGSSEIAEKSTSIAFKTNQVLEQANANKESAAYLNEMVQFFQI